MNINDEKNKLIKMLDVDSDCFDCGTVINDPTLLIPDPFNPGKFKSLCPACKKETWRVPLIQGSLKEVFEMIAECVGMKRPILVLTLACTAYEALIDDFVYRLLEKQNCSEDISSFVVDSTDLRTKIKLINSMMDKSIKKLAKDTGFKRLYNAYETIKQRRNGFLHTGCSYKMVEEKIGKYAFQKAVKLDEGDSLQGVKFAQELIDFFAILFTKYGKRQNGYEEF